MKDNPSKDCKEERLVGDKQNSNSHYSIHKHKRRRRRRRQQEEIDKPSAQSTQQSPPCYLMLRSFLNRSHSLNLNASQISSLTGYHPYTHLPRLLLDLVYQGRLGQALLRHDTQLLGIGMTDEAEELRKLAERAGNGVAVALRETERVRGGARMLSCVGEAEGIKKRLNKEIQKVVKKDGKPTKDGAVMLSKKEVERLVEGGRGYVDTGFGTYGEEQALDMYQEKCGWEVTDRNSEMMLWPFCRGEDSVGRSCVGEYKEKEENGNGGEEEVERVPTVVPMGPPYVRSLERMDRIEKLCETSQASYGGKGGSDARCPIVLIDEEHEEHENNDSNYTSDDKVEKENEIRKKGKGGNFHEVIEIHSDDDDDISGSNANDNKHKDNGKDDEENKEPSTSTNLIHDTVTSNKQTKNNKNKKKKKKKLKPFFTISGVVDGIRDEMYARPRSAPITTKTDPTFQKDSNNNDIDNENYDYDEDEEWAIRRVVVECKHRMKKAFLLPPIYDQIQAVVYCMMYGTTEADIVQVVRHAAVGDKGGRRGGDSAVKGRSRREARVRNRDNRKGTDTIQTEKDGADPDPSPIALEVSTDTAVTKVSSDSDPHEPSPTNTTNTNTNTNTNTTTPPSPPSPPPKNVEITCTRVTLDDPIFQHRQNWHTVLLPRLRSFVEAVYRIRASDEKRYGLLRAAALASSGGEEEEEEDRDEEWWDVLVEECPWVKDCDTARGRKKRGWSG